MLTGYATHLRSRLLVLLHHVAHWSDILFHLKIVHPVGPVFEVFKQIEFFTLRGFHLLKARVLPWKSSV
jgi:hypothetical protein